MPQSEIIPLEPIQFRILILRGVRVILDADLARLYGVATKRLNEQVKRNAKKFPEDFMFQLTPEEKAEVVAKCDHLKNLRFAKSLPYAFTEHGAIQAANILASDAASEMSVHVVRAFVRLRLLVVNHKAIATKLAELDAKVGAHDEQLAAVIAAIRQLTTPDEPRHCRKIGFHAGNR
ncbi:MAG: ORF6N domain-containing protein [Verrucomicrobia bacterium]|nr:ORF6N domain-containing protein [Verrucomicrobiota bacterium]